MGLSAFRHHVSSTPFFFFEDRDLLSLDSPQNPFFSFALYKNLQNFFSPHHFSIRNTFPSYCPRLLFSFFFCLYRLRPGRDFLYYSLGRSFAVFNCPPPLSRSKKRETKRARLGRDIDLLVTLYLLLSFHPASGKESSALQSSHKILSGA